MKMKWENADMDTLANAIWSLIDINVKPIHDQSPNPDKWFYDLDVDQTKHCIAMLMSEIRYHSDSTIDDFNMILNLTQTIHNMHWNENDYVDGLISIDWGCEYQIDHCGPVLEQWLIANEIYIPGDCADTESEYPYSSIALNCEYQNKNEFNTARYWNAIKPLMDNDMINYFYIKSLSPIGLQRMGTIDHDWMMTIIESTWLHTIIQNYDNGVIPK